jgi:hypothetical protein
MTFNYTLYLLGLFAVMSAFMGTLAYLIHRDCFATDDLEELDQ